MSDTPRTDEFVQCDCCDLDHCADFARQLERELADANARIAECLRMIPVGHIPSHNAENLPAMVADIVNQLSESNARIKDLESRSPELCAENGLDIDEHILRDLFAGMALQGQVSTEQGFTAEESKLAQWSYRLADAMLAARKEGA